MTKTVYFDLFDDGLYPLRAVTSGTLDRESPLNTLRLQTLLAILFRKPILVPEQWAVSSASFLKLARDVLCHYRTTVDERVSRSETREHSVFFPFRVRFFGSRSPKSPKQAYAQAFVERVTSGRRIQLSERLSGEREPRFNERIRRAFVTLPGDEIDASAAVQLRDALTEVVEDDVANWISDLAMQLSTHSHYVDFYDDAAYKHHIAHHVRVIGKHLYTAPELIESNDARIADFKAFLQEANQKQVSFSDLTDLWRLARQYPPPSLSLIVAAGRYVLHRAVATTLSAQYAGSALPSYFAERPKDYDSDVDGFFDGLRTAEVRLGGFNRRNDVDSWLTRADVSAIPQPAWPDVWREVWAFSISSKWKNLREKIEQTATVVPAEELYKCEEWDALAELVNAIPPFSAKRSQIDERYLHTEILSQRVQGESSELTTEIAGLSIAAGMTERTGPVERAVIPDDVQRSRELSEPK